ncbi:MAG: TRL-like family protein [Lentisphaeraceae bacterium]|nr:TRL-like family protein [Lentisphaeraceae bacterium]
MATRLVILCVLFCLCTSCAINGRLYTKKVVPFTENFKETPVGSKVCYIDDFKIQEPLSGYNVSAEWMRSNLLKEAQKAGMSEIYYADMETFSILLGIWTKRTLIVYGE